MKTKETIRARTKHAMQDRFGMAGNHREYMRLREAIRTQKAKCIGRVSHRVSVFLLSEAPGPMKILYDARRGEVVSVLPPDAEVAMRQTRNAEVA